MGNTQVLFTPQNPRPTGPSRNNGSISLLHQSCYLACHLASCLSDVTRPQTSQGIWKPLPKSLSLDSGEEWASLTFTAEDDGMRDQIQGNFILNFLLSPLPQPFLQTKCVLSLKWLPNPPFSPYVRICDVILKCNIYCHVSLADPFSFPLHLALKRNSFYKSHEHWELSHHSSVHCQAEPSLTLGTSL